MNTVSIVSGLAVGVLLGWSLQRGGFCMNTAFRSILFKEDRSTLRAWVLVLLINLPIVAILEGTGILYPAKAPFRPLSLAAGGLIFGGSMVWAGGCVSGTYYRASKGMLGSFIALLGFGMGVLTVNTGVLMPLRSAMNNVEWTIAGEIPTMGHIWPADPWRGRWAAIGILMIPGVIFLSRSPKSRFGLGWKWPVTGAVVGVLALAAWVFSSLEGRDYGLSLVQPTAAWASWILDGDPTGLNWTAWMLLALPVGAAAAAWKINDLRLRLPDPKRVLVQFAGGLGMGVGASLAGGCNIGHGITGLSALALSSLTATVFTIAGNWAATALVWHQSKREAT